jgi:hypothetical protein
MTEWLCVFCNEPVDPISQYTWHRVHAFERTLKSRASGKQGGSDITLRKPLEEFAHPACISLAQDGRLLQESLL